MIYKKGEQNILSVKVKYALLFSKSKIYFIQYFFITGCVASESNVDVTPIAVDVFYIFSDVKQLQ